MAALIPLLRAAGLTVSTIKHAHHGLDLDRPGKDSFIHRQAGAHEVLVAGGLRWALLHETPGGTPDLMALAGRLAPVDLVLVEGFKAYDVDKIEVHRPSLGKPPIWPDARRVVAVATDTLLPDCRCPVLPLNDPAAIAAWIRTEWIGDPSSRPLRNQSL